MEVIIMTLAPNVYLDEKLVNTLECHIFKSMIRNTAQTGCLDVALDKFKSEALGGQKTRAWGQIKGKSCQYARAHFFVTIIMNLG